MHDVVERMDTHDLWPEEAPPEVRGYADAYLRFRIEDEYRPIRCEIPLISAQWGYAGTSDKVGFLRARRTLIDVKTPRVVDRPATTIQLEAYRGLWNEHFPTARIHHVAALQLRDDGTYTLHRLDSPRAWRVFLCALRAYRDDATPCDHAEIQAWIDDYRRPHAPH